MGDVEHRENAIADMMRLYEEITTPSKEAKSRLEELEIQILSPIKKTTEEWLAISNEVSELIHSGSESKESILHFTRSGAGEMLYMICFGVKSKESLVGVEESDRLD